MFEFNSLKTHFFQIHFQPIFFQENNFTHKTKLFFFYFSTTDTPRNYYTQNLFFQNGLKQTLNIIL